MSDDERVRLEAEMQSFAVEVAMGHYQKATERRLESGTEDIEPIQVKGNVDGVPYFIYMPPRKNLMSEDK